LARADNIAFMHPCNSVRAGLHAAMQKNARIFDKKRSGDVHVQALCSGFAGDFRPDPWRRFGAARNRCQPSLGSWKPSSSPPASARKSSRPSRSPSTSFSQADLDRLHVGTIEDLRFLAPSVHIAPTTFRQDTLNVTIRGQRDFDSSSGQSVMSFDPAAAVYMDGVYLARPVGLTGGLFDIERVEVLKGPQGTLVGRNTTGGAILYRTREPGPDVRRLSQGDGGRLWPGRAAGRGQHSADRHAVLPRRRADQPAPRLHHQSLFRSGHRLSQHPAGDGRQQDRGEFLAEVAARRDA
jgi:hypothetical protein